MQLSSVDTLGTPPAQYAEANGTDPSASQASAEPWGLFDEQALPTSVTLAIIHRAATAGHVKQPFAPTPANPCRLSPETFNLFKRPPEVERKAPTAVAAYEARWGGLPQDEQRAILDLFAAAGAFAPAKTRFTKPEVVALFSATVPYTRARVDFLARQVSAGTLYVDADTKVFLLGGQRALFANWTEPRSTLTDPAGYQQEPSWRPPSSWPTTEIAATQLVWNQQLLPETLRGARVQALPTDATATRSRAHGSDVTRALAAQFDEAPRSILVVSGSPFVEQHVLSTRLALQQRGLSGVRVEGTGGASPEYWRGLSSAQRLGILFDHLANLCTTADQLRSAPGAADVGHFTAE